MPVKVRGLTFMPAVPPSYRCTDCPDTYWRGPETVCWVCGQAGQVKYIPGVFSGAATYHAGAA